MSDPNTTGAETGAPETGEPELLQRHDFEPHVGKIFHFKGTRYAFPLDHIDSFEQPAPSWVKRRPFILIFRGPKERAVLPEGLYETEVEGGPIFHIHVAPIQTHAPDRQDYQVVFG